MDKCDFSIDYIDFLSVNTTTEVISRWIHLCKALYVDNCKADDILSMLPYASLLLEHASYADCTSRKELTAYCISIILSVLIIILNVILISAIVKSRLFRVNNIINILSLAFSDLLLGITFIYSTTWDLLLLGAGFEFDADKVVKYVNIRNNQYLCLILDGPGLLFACMMSSVLSITLIAIERYIAIFHSYKYVSLVTKRRLLFAVSLIWLVSMIVAILPVSGWNNFSGTCQLTKIVLYEYFLLLSIICVLCALLILLVYIRIFTVAWQHNRLIHAQQLASIVTNANGDHTLTSTGTYTTDSNTESNESPQDRRPSALSSNSTEELLPKTVEQNHYYIADVQEKSSLDNISLKVNNFGMKSDDLEKQSQINGTEHDTMMFPESDQTYKNTVSNTDAKNIHNMEIMKKSKKNQQRIVDFKMVQNSGNHNHDMNDKKCLKIQISDINHELVKEPSHKVSKKFCTRFDENQNTSNGISVPEINLEDNIQTSSGISVPEINLKDNIQTSSGISVPEINLKDNIPTGSLDVESDKNDRSHSGYELENDERTEEQPHSHNLKLMCSKPVRTTILVLGAFYVCWMPFLIYLLVFKDNYVNLTVYYLAIVTQINSILNPIIYGIRNADIRKGIKKLFCCKSRN